MIKIVRFKPEYIKDISKVLIKTYVKFCSSDATSEGVENLKKHNDWRDPRFRERTKKKDFVFVAKDNRKIVGVIMGDKDRLSGFAVLGDWHKKGIGTKLLQKFEEEAKKLSWKNIKARSSLHALNFYRKQGYKKTTGIRNIDGNKYQGVKKILE